jgi:alpha-ketoglutaric semialdehyde dehydrogenase
MTNTNDLPAFFGGKWSRSSDDAWIPVLDPADLRREVARVPALTAADVTHAYDVAEEGSHIWRTTGPLTRGAVLLEASRLLRERSQAIVEDLVAEMGKTIAEASVEVTKTADFFEYYGGMARTSSGYSLSDGRPNTTTGVRFEPIGIVLAITPWNDPILTPARKLAPALFAGNAVVLKPSTDTPLVSLHLLRALLDAGLPPAVLSVVTGRGRDTSPALLGDSRLAAVSFTGSNEVGLQIMTALTQRNIRLQTEMGGKNATAVLADADLDLAADTVVAAAFAQAGQRCTATSRLIVDRAIASDFLDRILARVGSLRVGPGSETTTTLGPVINESQRSSVLSSVATAIDEGATVLAGGHMSVGSGLENGCFVEPTVLRVCADMKIWREEVFGPVLCVSEVTGFEEACDAINDSMFGLSAALFTSNLESAHRFIERANTGQVAVNLPTSGWDVHHPFGGFRASGSPFKEQGIEALHFYSRAKTYAVRYA